MYEKHMAVRHEAVSDVYPKPITKADLGALLLTSRLLPPPLQAETSISSLRVDGRPSKLIRSHDAYLAAEARDGMIPWNGNAENLIDRFDGRALLDMYIDPDPRAKRQKSDGELELEEVLLLP